MMAIVIVYIAQQFLIKCIIIATEVVSYDMIIEFQWVALTQSFLYLFLSRDGTQFLAEVHIMYNK